MSWDTRVAAWLDEVTVQLRATGLVELVERTVAAVWERNVERYDAAVAGDTPTSLGIMSAENLRELLLREDDEECRDMRILSSHQTLTICVGGLSILLMKAADRRLDPDGPAELDWTSTRWDTASDVRRHAAETNARLYEPRVREQAGQLWWPGLTSSDGPHHDPTALRHLMIVWAGDVVTSTTSGWLAVPYAGPGVVAATPWLAATVLWHHGLDAVPRPREPIIAVPRVR